jgi:hypothetical protein
MSNESHAMMQAEHTLWDFEHSTWSAEAEAWRGEVIQAINELQDIRSMLEDHEVALDAHLDAIAKHQRSETEHKQSLAAGELLSMPTERADPMTAVHAGEAERHRAQREAHERMKAHQHAIMTTWSIMMEALRRAM